MLPEADNAAAAVSRANAYYCVCAHRYEIWWEKVDTHARSRCGIHRMGKSVGVIYFHMGKKRLKVDATYVV